MKLKVLYPNQAHKHRTFKRVKKLHSNFSISILPNNQMNHPSKLRNFDYLILSLQNLKYTKLEPIYHRTHYTQLCSEQ